MPDLRINTIKPDTTDEFERRFIARLLERGWQWGVCVFTGRPELYKEFPTERQGRAEATKCEIAAVRP